MITVPPWLAERRQKEASVKICMIGAGYVGLVSAACFADFGWTVTCVDKDAGRVARLKRGEVPIFEPGLRSCWRAMLLPNACISA